MKRSKRQKLKALGQLETGLPRNPLAKSWKVYKERATVRRNPPFVPMSEATLSGLRSRLKN